MTPKELREILLKKSINRFILNGNLQGDSDTRVRFLLRWMNVYEMTQLKKGAQK